MSDQPHSVPTESSSASYKSPSSPAEPHRDPLSPISSFVDSDPPQRQESAAGAALNQGASTALSLVKDDEAASPGIKPAPSRISQISQSESSSAPCVAGSGSSSNLSVRPNFEDEASKSPPQTNPKELDLAQLTQTSQLNPSKPESPLPFATKLDNSSVWNPFRHVVGQQAFDLKHVYRPLTNISANDFIFTPSGNRISISSIVCRNDKVQVGGRTIIHPGVLLRGDLAAIKIGRYVSIGRNCVIRPPLKSTERTDPVYIPVCIGDYVTIGPNCVISAASIESNCIVGENTILERKCLVKNNSVIEPNSLLTPESIVPPLSVMSGRPARRISQLLHSFETVQRDNAIKLYDSFCEV